MVTCILMAKQTQSRSESSRDGEGQSVGPRLNGMAPGDMGRYLESLRWIEQMLFQWATIAQSSDDAIIGQDLDGIVTSWNPAAEEMYGYTAEEMIGKSISVVFPPDRQDELPMILSKINRGEQIRHYETKRRRKDGHIFDVSVTVSPIHDIAGHLIGASKIARDISHRKQLDEQRFKLAAIVDSSDDAIISKSLDGVILSWNKGAERIYGYSAEEAVGRSILFLFPPDRADELPRLLGQIRAGKKIEHYETQRVRKDGKKIHVSVTISPITDADGKVTAASVIARDISRQVEFERLKELESRKNEFISMASHELRTPITSIKIHTEVLRRQNMQLGSDALARSVEKIDLQVERLTRLIDELLTLSRIEQGRLVISHSRFDLSAVAREVVEDSYGTSGRNVLVEGDGEFVVDGDRDKIVQVLVILLNNAVKYSKEGSSIRVRIARQKDAAVVSVQDEGIGIATENLEKVFDRFYQVSDAAEKTYPGLGMGLFIAHTIVGLHGGKIWAESEPGRGSTFLFALPLAKGRKN